jgi:Transposase DNA-binding/Transposase DDE domain
MSKRGELAKNETRGVELGDARLERRFGQLMEMMAGAPDLSFPHASGDSDAALEATYRFLNNESVSHGALLAPHYASTLERMRREAEVLVVHDTTEFRFEGDREGLGRLQQDLQGFLGHFALAVSADGRRRAFGVIGFLPVIRSWEPVTAHWRMRYRDASKESLRWGKLVNEVAERTQGGPALIHVMDREADSFELLSDLVEHQQRLIIRVRAEHRWTLDAGHVGNATQGLEVFAEREVAVSARKARYVKGTSKSSPRPARAQRIGKLQIRARTVQLKPPDRSKAAPVTMNLVHVTEVGAPDGQEPVDWKLYTTDAIETVDQILLVVDRYRSRWVIEEYFKALKTGCAYERRQLGSGRALLNALAVFVPIAWTLLVLRQECRDVMSVPTALTPVQLHVLRAVLRKPLPPNPTARDVLLAIAALGGHIKNNGDPGWQVLGRGLDRLLSYEVGWSAATRDQS